MLPEAGPPTSGAPRREPPAAPPAATPAPTPRPGLVHRTGARLLDAATVAFGLATLVLVLATIAAIPVVQVLSLGYLLEAEGRLARGGRLGDALPGLRLMARIGGALLGLVLVFLPFLVAADLAHDAALIDPGSREARRTGTAAAILLGLASVQALLAVARGGRFSFFFRPLGNVLWAVRRVRGGAPLGGAREGVGGFLRGLRLGHYFALGLKGFVAALGWLVLPTALLALGQERPGLGLLGGLFLALAVIPLPLLQARVAAEGRIRAGFELGAAWRRYRAAPLWAFLSLLATLGLALPLYVFKVELIPRDARWLPAVLFLVVLLPAKLFTGFAYARGGRERRAHLAFRFSSALLALPVAVSYVVVLYLNRFIDWEGARGLFQQHAFLLPIAF